MKVRCPCAEQQLTAPSVFVLFPQGSSDSLQQPFLQTFLSPTRPLSRCYALNPRLQLSLLSSSILSTLITSELRVIGPAPLHQGDPSAAGEALASLTEPL